MFVDVSFSVSYSTTVGLSFFTRRLIPFLAFFNSSFESFSDDDEVNVADDDDESTLSIV